jgi:hypothetical protein
MLTVIRLRGFCLTNMIVFFSGYNQRAVMAFVRVVDKYRIPFVIVASGPEDAMYHSRYREKICYERTGQSLDLKYFESAIECLHDTYPMHNYIFIPSAEALNRFLLDNREYFTRKRVIIPLVEKNIYEAVSNKYSFRALCQQSSISVPGEYKEVSTLPVVAKPKKYFSLRDGRSLYPYLLHTEADRNRFLKSEHREDFFLEEFVEGESYYLLYYLSKSHDVISYSQKNLVQQPDGKSIIAAVPATVHDQEISSKFISLFRKINFWGLAMVEVRFDGSDYYLIEANPRLWGPSQLFVDAGVRFFQYYLTDMGFNLDFDRGNKYTEGEVKYFWFGGLVSTMRENRKPLYHKGMTEDEFFACMDLFMQNDVYQRRDTIQIYLRELL